MGRCVTAVRACGGATMEVHMAGSAQAEMHSRARLGHVYHSAGRPACIQCHCNTLEVPTGTRSHCAALDTPAPESLGCR